MKAPVVKGDAVSTVRIRLTYKVLPTHLNSNGILRTWKAKHYDLLALDIVGNIDFLWRKSMVEFDTWDKVPCFDGSHDDSKTFLLTLFVAEE